MKQGKTRADQRLLDLALAESIAKAQALILAGRVVDQNDHRIHKAGELVSTEAVLRLTGKTIDYVSRGGLKLEAALDSLDLSVAGATCLDVGASTGGFTDVLLRRGAEKVYALDVGYGQLSWSLRDDPRVVVMERTNIRHVRPDAFIPLPRIVVIDVSFISLTKVLPCLPILIEPGASCVALVKPQFELSRDKIGAGGIVIEPRYRQEALESVIGCAKEQGAKIVATLPSPIRGAKGNTEFLLILSFSTAISDTDACR